MWTSSTSISVRKLVRQYTYSVLMWLVSHPIFLFISLSLSLFFLYPPLYFFLCFLSPLLFSLTPFSFNLFLFLSLSISFYLFYPSLSRSLYVFFLSYRLTFNLYPFGKFKNWDKHIFVIRFVALNFIVLIFLMIYY